MKICQFWIRGFSADQPPDFKYFFSSIEFLCSSSSSHLEFYPFTYGISVNWNRNNTSSNRYCSNTTGPQLLEPMQFIVGIRINNAQMLLETTTYSVNEISKIVGYDNQLYFSRLFHKLKGYSPREYRKIYFQ